MSHRKEQVESLMKKALAEVIARRLSDPRIEGMISITRIDCSPDLRDCMVYVSVLPDHVQKKTLNGLRHAAPHIHHKVKQLVALKTVPHLDFRLDASLKKQAEVLDAIRKIQEDEDAVDDAAIKPFNREAADPPEPPEPPDTPDARRAPADADADTGITDTHTDTATDLDTRKPKQAGSPDSGSAAEDAAS